MSTIWQNLQENLKQLSPYFRGEATAYLEACQKPNITLDAYNQYHQTAMVLTQYDAMCGVAPNFMQELYDKDLIDSVLLRVDSNNAENYQDRRSPAQIQNAQSFVFRDSLQSSLATSKQIIAMPSFGKHENGKPLLEKISSDLDLTNRTIDRMYKQKHLQLSLLAASHVSMYNLAYDVLSRKSEWNDPIKKQNHIWRLMVAQSFFNDHNFAFIQPGLKLEAKPLAETVKNWAKNTYQSLKKEEPKSSERPASINRQHKFDPAYFKLN